MGRVKNPGEYEILRTCKTKNFYQKLLSLSTPWSINDVELRMDKLKVTVRLIHQTSWRFRCKNVMRNVPHTDSKGTEVDVIPESPAGEIVGIEVKATMTSRAEDFSRLRHLQSFVGERFRRGFLLHTGDRAISLRFPRFRRHLTWRDNAPGGEHDEEEKATVYGRVQGRRG